MDKLILDEEFNVLSAEMEIWLIELIYKPLSLKSTNLWVLETTLLDKTLVFMLVG